MSHQPVLDRESYKTTNMEGVEIGVGKCDVCGQPIKNTANTKWEHVYNQGIPLTPLKSTHQQSVEHFMRLAKQDVPLYPTMPSEAVRKLRVKLILEEALETIEALGFDVQVDTRVQGIVFIAHGRGANLIEIIDGCNDIKVVTTGTLSACGVPDEPFQRLIDENNLAKFGPGHTFREDGKLIKPPGHKKPDIALALDGLFPTNRQQTFVGKVVKGTDPVEAAKTTGYVTNQERATVGEFSTEAWAERRRQEILAASPAWNNLDKAWKDNPLAFGSVPIAEQPMTGPDGITAVETFPVEKPRSNSYTQECTKCGVPVHNNNTAKMCTPCFIKMYGNG